MTDEQIIKALECCVKTEFISDCAKCEMFAFDCKDILIENALVFINRQRAKIEQEINQIKSEARKEFAESLKDKLLGMGTNTTYGKFKYCVVKSYEIDNLLKEMEG